MMGNVFFWIIKKRLIIKKPQEESKIGGQDHMS